MLKTLFSLTLIMLFCLVKSSFAQSELRPEADNMIQGRYWLQLNVTDRLRLNEMLINQTFISGGFRQRQLLNHLFLRYAGKKKEFYGLGFSYSNRWQDVETGFNRFVVPEFRIFQEIGRRGNLPIEIRTNSFFRLEQRFFHNANQSYLTKGFRYLGRIRYAQVFIRDFGERFTGRVNNTVFFNFLENTIKPTFSFNRISLGIDYHFSKKVSINGEYQLQARKVPDYDKLSLGNVMRVSIIHGLSLRERANL